MVKCQNCGEIVSISKEYCPNCGQWIDKKGREKKKVNPIILIVVVIIVFSLIFVSMYFLLVGINTKHDIDLKVIYPYEWEGGITLPDFSQKSINGIGNMTYSYTGYKGDIFVILIQKNNDSSYPLGVGIYDNDELVNFQYTTTPYGIVTQL